MIIMNHIAKRVRFRFLSFSFRFEYLCIPLLVYHIVCFRGFVALEMEINFNSFWLFYAFQFAEFGPSWSY